MLFLAIVPFVALAFDFTPVASEFDCANGNKKVPLRSVCNGADDCGDGSDEPQWCRFDRSLAQTSQKAQAATPALGPQILEWLLGCRCNGQLAHAGAESVCTFNEPEYSCIVDLISGCPDKRQLETGAWVSRKACQEYERPSHCAISRKMRGTVNVGRFRWTSKNNVRAGEHQRCQELCDEQVTVGGIATPCFGYGYLKKMVDGKQKNTCLLVRSLERKDAMRAMVFKKSGKAKCWKRKEY